MTPRGDRVNDARVPVFQRGGKVDEEDHWHPTFWSELSVGEVHTPRSDDPGGGVLVRRDEVGLGFALLFMIVPPFLCPTGPGGPDTAR